MMTQHAITFQDRLTPDQLEYVVRKANRLGLNGRGVVRVYTQADSEGNHLYFETAGTIKNDTTERIRE